MLTWVGGLIFCILLPPSSLSAEVTSTTGNLYFMLDSTPVALLNQYGFGIGAVSPAANLQVQGNAVITQHVSIGDAVSHSNLHVQGSMGMSLTFISTNTTLQESGSSSIVLADTNINNITLQLPYSGNVTGRTITIKKTSVLNSLYLTGGGNNIDDLGTVEFTASSNLAAAEVVSSGTQWYITESTTAVGTLAASNLLAWWKLDETSGVTAVDSSGQGHDGTLKNSTSFALNAATGKFGGGFKGDNSNDYIAVNHHVSLNPSTFTLSTWVNYYDFTGSDTFISHGDGSGNLAGFFFRCNDTTQKFALYISLAPNVYSSVIGSTVAQAGQWYHIAASYDLSNMRLYVNGNEESVTARTEVIDYGSGGNIRLANAIHATAGSPGATVDDIRFYDKALSTQEIEALYLSGK